MKGTSVFSPAPDAAQRTYQNGETFIVGDAGGMIIHDPSVSIVKETATMPKKSTRLNLRTWPATATPPAMSDEKAKDRITLATVSIQYPPRGEHNIGGK